MRGTTRTGAAIELTGVEWVLRLAAVVAAAAALWLLVGANGLGLVGAYGRPGAPSGAGSVVTERTTLTGAAGEASVRTANERLGPLEQRSDEAATRTTSGRTDLAEVSGPTEVTVTFWSPGRAQRWAWVLVRALPAAAAAAGLWLLADLTRSARRGDPFTRANVRRLLAVTGLVALGGVVGDWGSGLVRLWLLDGSDVADQVPVEASLSFGFVGVVLLLGVVTEVWRRGVAMRADLEGLV